MVGATGNSGILILVCTIGGKMRMGACSTCPCVTGVGECWPPPPPPEDALGRGWYARGMKTVVSLSLSFRICGGLAAINTTATTTSACRIPEISVERLDELSM